MSSSGNTYFASIGLELELLYTCMTTTLAQRSSSFALMWTDCNGTNVSLSNRSPGFTFVNGSSRFSMSVVEITGMSSSLSDDPDFSSSERAVVGSHKIFSLQRKCRTKFLPDLNFGLLFGELFHEYAEIFRDF